MSPSPSALRTRALLPWLLAALAGACGDGASAGMMPDAGFSSHAAEAITADWLERRLSYVDMGALQAGASRADVVMRTVDLSAYSPGPLVVELSPDGRTALVSISAGFFSIAGAGFLVDAQQIPTDPGKLLVLDAPSGEIEDELETGESPMGIAITPDGKRAFVAHFTSGDIALVDLDSREVLERVEVGVYAEEIALDDSAEVGLVGYSTDGSVRTFAVADLAGTLSPRVALEGDSAGVAFFPGTKVAFVVQAPNPLSPMAGYTTLDVNDPSAPVVLEDVRLDEAPVAYPAMAAPSRNSVLVPATVAGRLVLREYELVEERVALKSELDVADGNLLEALGLGFDGDHTVLLACAKRRALIVVDLEEGSSRELPWQQELAGPADVVAMTE